MKKIHISSNYNHQWKMGKTLLLQFVIIELKQGSPISSVDMTGIFCYLSIAGEVVCSFRNSSERWRVLPKKCLNKMMKATQQFECIHVSDDPDLRPRWASSVDNSSCWYLLMSLIFKSGQRYSLPWASSF